MPYQAELSQWTREVSSNLAHLSRCQAYALALYSYAVVLTQSCGLSQEAYFLGQLLGQRENTVRQRLLAEVKGSLSTDYCVWVTADRGLYAKWLFSTIQANSWHPLLRINAQGTCVERHSGRRWSLAMLAALCRQRLWREEVVCFKDEARLPCTLLAMWEESQQEAWLLLTDVPPLEASPSWYALRMNIEAGFKALKSAGFHWERTRMSDPARAERLWLVLTLAALRAVSAAEGLPAPPPQHPWPSLPLRRRSTKPRYPRLSLLKRGLLASLAAVIRGAALSYHLPAPPLPRTPLLETLDPLKTYP
ncbi:MAG: transposase [Anaerolineae bacterium]|nr:transposase [Anaerolineae bacterium]